MNNVTPINKDSSSGGGGVGSAEKFVHFLTDAAQGNFLFVKLVLDQITRGNLVIKSSFKVLPVSLSEVFLLECNLRFSSIKSYEKARIDVKSSVKQNDKGPINLHI